LQLLGKLQFVFQASDDLFGLLDALKVASQLVRLQRSAMPLQAVVNSRDQFCQPAGYPGSFGQLSKLSGRGGMKRFMLAHHRMNISIVIFFIEKAKL
jgi:hypothetical protein